MTSGSDLLAAVLAAALAGVFRAIVIAANRGLFRQGLVGDASIHLAIIRQLRRDPRARYIDQYLIRSEPMSYPRAFHWFCALFPARLLERRPYVPSFVVFVGGVFIFSLWFCHVQTDLLGDHGWGPLFAAVAAFLLMPGNYAFFGPGVAYLTLSERLLARTSCGIFFATALVAAQFHDLPSIVIAVIAAAIAFGVALFARQAVLFITPVMSLLLWSAMPLCLMLAGAAVATIVSRRYFILSMSHTFAQWVLYATDSKRSPSVRANLAGFVRYQDLKARLAQGRLLRYLAQREPFKSLLFLPEVALALAVLAITVMTGTGSRLAPATLAAPIIAAAIVYLLTATPWLDHLGECYRYLEYGTYFTVPLIFSLAWQGIGPFVVAPMLVLLTAQGGLVLFLVYGIYHRNVPWPARDELGEFIAAMRLPADAVVYPIPLSVAGDLCARRPYAKSFWYQPGLISKAMFREFFEQFPFLKCDAGPIIERFGVTHAICDKRTLTQLPAPCRLPGMVRILETERFIGFARAAAGSAAPVAVIEPIASIS